MKEYIERTVREFIAENWAAFKSFCEGRGDGLADEVYQELGGDLVEEGEE